MFVLRLVDDLNGVICRKDDAHVKCIMPFFHLLGQAFAVRRGWISKFVDEGLHNIVVLSSFLTYLGIGTDGETVQGSLALLCPLRECLREQREAWYQKQYSFIFACQLFGNLECSECLARSASHDELTAVSGFESVQDIANSDLLMWSGVVPFFERWGMFCFELGPIDLAVFKVAQFDAVDRRLLVKE